MRTNLSINHCAEMLTLPYDKSELDLSENDWADLSNEERLHKR
ncbi:TPA: hypothetical protein ACGOWA_000868 [Streptococcus suis]